MGRRLVGALVETAVGAGAGDPLLFHAAVAKIQFHMSFLSGLPSYCMICSPSSPSRQEMSVTGVSVIVSSVRLVNPFRGLRSDTAV